MRPQPSGRGVSRDRDRNGLAALSLALVVVGPLLGPEGGPRRNRPVIRSLTSINGWWGYVDLNHGPLPYQVMPSGSPGPGTASYQALRWHTLAQTSLNWHRRAPFCPSKCPSDVRSLTPGAHRDAPHLHQARSAG